MTFENFDWQVYVNKYEDLAQITTQSHAFEHWNKYGKYENRVCTFTDFDWQYYINKYDDLNNIDTREKALKHWFRYGQYEARIYNIKQEIQYINKPNNILIIGDSHSNHIKIKYNYKHLLCSAGSAKGLNNINSRSGYNKLILNEVKNNNYDLLIFLFGGVDVDFCFIHKFLEDPKMSYETFNNEVIDNYIKFIDNNFYGIKIIILSIGLPTLSDLFLKKGLLNAHINQLENKDLKQLKHKLTSVNYLPDIYTRTKITLDFNNKLQKKIQQLNNNNIYFLDVTLFQYDYSKRRIKDEFFSTFDHHNYKRNSVISNIISNSIDNIYN